MKSLILKDLYNIGHNAKSMLFILLVFAVSFIPTSGVQAYIFICANLCGMMTMTTFSFDENSKWIRYAIVMPVSKKELVASKFIVLFIFIAIGSVIGLVIGIIGGIITSNITINLISLYELVLSAFIAFGVASIFGGLSIPLVFKFGAEKGRILLLASFLIPAAIGFGVYWLISALGIILTEQSILVLIGCSPIFVLLWNYVMYEISYKNIYNKDL